MHTKKTRSKIKAPTASETINKKAVVIRAMKEYEYNPQWDHTCCAPLKVPSDLALAEGRIEFDVTTSIAAQVVDEEKEGFWVRALVFVPRKWMNKK